jgi:hypothetical protein
MTSPFKRRESQPSVTEWPTGSPLIEVAKAKEFPGKDYDFVAVFDCLHDMGDPVGAAAHVRAALTDNGSWMVVEPFANERPSGQSQSHGPRLLFILDFAVHALFPIAGGGMCLLRQARSEYRKWSILPDLALAASGVPHRRHSI